MIEYSRASVIENVCKFFEFVISPASDEFALALHHMLRHPEILHEISSERHFVHRDAALV
ncbi:hypothetical protein SDC9_149971 [bioreactor metagenome]|uniref:Uncharacterized protein n=1 Tax=bioreactor metagenome TaxID=1076179 RepID=A0A645EL36_9ZZZZ